MSREVVIEGIALDVLRVQAWLLTSRPEVDRQAGRPFCVCKDRLGTDATTANSLCVPLICFGKIRGADMNGKRALLMTIVAFAIPTGHGKAQQVGQPGRGLASAEHLCAQCHAVQKGLARSRNENAPSFQAIASVPGMTEMALSAALNTSHATMPNIVLEPDERADIIAYILSLK